MGLHSGEGLVPPSFSLSYWCQGNSHTCSSCTEDLVALPTAGASSPPSFSLQSHLVRGTQMFTVSTIHFVVYKAARHWCLSSYSAVLGIAITLQRRKSLHEWHKFHSCQPSNWQSEQLQRAGLALCVSSPTPHEVCLLPQKICH